MLGWVVFTPRPGPSRMEGAAPAALNAMSMVLCTDYNGLEPSLGPLGVLPTMEVDLGFCVGVLLSQWLPGFPRRGIVEEGVPMPSWVPGGPYSFFPFTYPRPWRWLSPFAFWTDRGLRQERKDLPEAR